jgi:hypothetical protein
MDENKVIWQKFMPKIGWWSDFDETVTEVQNIVNY